MADYCPVCKQDLDGPIGCVCTTTTHHRCPMCNGTGFVPEQQPVNPEANRQVEFDGETLAVTTWPKAP